MFRVAWRNILRNKRRSLVSLLIIIISVVVLSLFKGYNRGTYEGLTMLSVMEYGNFQIAKEGYWSATGSSRHLISDEEINLINSILDEETEVVSTSMELAMQGIMGTEKSSTIVAATGLDLANIASENLMITSGLNLFEGDTDRVLLGQGVKDILGVEEEEWVSLMATTLDGAYNAGNLQVSGSFSYGNTDADNFFAIVPLCYAQSMLNTRGVDKYKVTLRHVGATEKVIESVRQKFAAAGLGVEIKSWLDLADFYHQVRSLYETVFFFVSLILFVLVFFSILEIVSLAFFERMREIGSIRAIGARRREVFSLLGQEGLILGLIGGILGVLVGWFAGKLINDIGITYTPPSMSQPVQVYIYQAWTNGLKPFIVVLAATLFAAIIPALKAARLNVTEVLRHL